MDFNSAKVRLNGRVSRKLANHTYLQARTDGIAVRLHGTDVITYHEDGSMVLTSGGWKTPTTKSRLNEYLTGRISQDKGVWYYIVGGKEYVFGDGMIIYPDGTVSGEGPNPKAILQLRKQVSMYAKGFIVALRAGEVPAPSNGDCFYCLMRTEEGKTLGESFKDHDHIMSHLEESYYVPTLLTRAMEVIGASQAMKWAIGEIWQEQEASWGKSEWIWQSISKCLVRYILRQLGEVS